MTEDLIHKLISKRYLLVAVILLPLTASVVSGAPPHPDLVARAAAGEIELPYYLSHYHQLRSKGVNDPDIHPGTVDKRSDGMLALSPRYAGEFRVLAVLVDFADNPASVDGSFFDSLVFGDVGPTVREYYREVSYDQVLMTSVDLPSDLGWRRAPQTYAYYVNGQNGIGSYPQNSQKLVEDIIEQIDPLVDFSIYDNDGDGDVDGLVVIHAGQGAEYGGGSDDIWSHKWNISGQYRDGVYLSSYTIQPEYLTMPGDQTIGVIAHELGHVFGLPDLYDTDYSSHGVGKWGLMSFGSWLGPRGRGESPAHLCAWSKMELGWITPTGVVQAVLAQTIANVEETGECFRLSISDTAGSEYFLVENRQRTGFDSYLPGSGLLIWHIDDAQDGNTGEWYPGLATSTHYQVALEQADGLYELERKSDHGDAGDPFPGSLARTSFNATTIPNSNAYNGTISSLAVENITLIGSVVQADLLVGYSDDSLVTGGEDPPLPERVTLAQNYPNPFNPSTTISFATAGSARAVVEVYNSLGQKAATILDRVVPAGETSVVFDGIGENGRQLASGVYYYRVALAGFEEAKKMVLVR